MLTISIIVFTCALSLLGFYQQQVNEKLLLWPYKMVHGNEWYRIISNGFMHSGIMHLAFNMISLYSLGRVVEAYFSNYFGKAGMLLYGGMYLLAIPVSCSYDIIRFRNTPNYRALGASGAVCAIIFTFILLLPREDILYFGIPIPSFIFGPIFLIISAFLGKRNFGNIAHWTHIGGALFGFFFPVLIRPAFLLEFIESIKQFSH
jgi:membrane associated rhomboid family serine protease